jgi:hypothetical protein
MLGKEVLAWGSVIICLAGIPQGAVDGAALTNGDL